MKYRKLIIEIISALFVLLWVYAAVSKLMDFQTFKVQLSKSPLLTSFAGFAATAVPVSEIIITCLLVFTKTRLLGLYASLFMITILTIYLIAILNFSYYIPCSCGGILSGLGWTEHIIFNCGFILLAILAVFLSKKKEGDETYKDYVIAEKL